MSQQRHEIRHLHPQRGRDGYGTDDRRGSLSTWTRSATAVTSVLEKHASEVRRMSTDQGAVQFEGDVRVGLVIGDVYDDQAIVEPVRGVLLGPGWWDVVGHGGGRIGTRVIE